MLISKFVQNPQHQNATSNPSGIEKLLCQGFPVHRLKLRHLSNAAPWTEFNVLTATHKISIVSPLNAFQWEKVDQILSKKTTPRKYTNWLEMLSMWNQWLPHILAPYQCVIWTSSMQQWRTVCGTEGVKKCDHGDWNDVTWYLCTKHWNPQHSPAYDCHWFLKFSMLKLTFVSSRNPWIAHCFHDFFSVQRPSWLRPGRYTRSIVAKDEL